jgi:hypothetical protein
MLPLVARIDAMGEHLSKMFIRHDLKIVMYDNEICKVQQLLSVHSTHFPEE